MINTIVTGPAVRGVLFFCGVCPRAFLRLTFSQEASSVL